MYLLGGLRDNEEEDLPDASKDRKKGTFSSYTVFNVSQCCRD